MGNKFSASQLALYRAVDEVLHYVWSRPVAEVRTAKTRVATLTVDAGSMPIELTPMCGPAAARVMVVKTSFAVSPHREHRHPRAAPLDAHRWKRFESDSRR